MPTDIQIVKPDLIIEGNDIATPKRAALNFINATVTDDAINNQTNVIIPPSGITIGTTTIASGVTGRVLFEGAGNVVQQDASFSFSSSTKSLESRGKGGSTVTVLGFSAGADVLGFGYTGTNNVHIGNYAGAYISSGSQSTFVGANSGTSIRTGERNTFIGYNGHSYPIGLSNNVVITDGSSYTAFWKDANNLCGIGYASQSDTLGARLDVRAQGALSTDIAFRVRNSADTKNIVEVRGDSETRWNGLPAVGNYVAIKNYTSYDATIDLMGGSGIKAQISMDPSSNLTINRGLNIWNPGIVGSTTAKINNIVKSGLGAYGAGYGFNWAFTSNVDGIFTQAERALWLTSTKSLVLFNGSSIPDTHSEKADSFEMYSDDITAGNAAPHFRTENGSLIKLYKQDLPTNPTNAQIATFLSNLGLANLI